MKGWRHAAYDLVAFIDANVLVPSHCLHGLVTTFRDDTGVVSAPPCGLGPVDFGAHLECAFLNTFELRWQYVVDTFGSGFAQGKTLVYRKADLDRSAMRELAAEPAEDAATTKMVRRAGKRIRLAPPSPLPLDVRSFAQVWGRQLRWARLRRATFPLEFLPEILSGSVVPALCVVAAALANETSPAAAVAVYLAVWYAGELALARACRWPAGWRMPFAMMLRDLVLPALWGCAFFGGTVTWNGTVVHMKGGGDAPTGRAEPAGKHLADHQVHVAAEAAEQPAHVVGAQRHAAQRGPQAGSAGGLGAMKKDRAAAPGPTRFQVVVEDEHDIVQAVAAPHVLVAEAHRQGPRPVVGRGRRVVAPAEVARKRAQRHPARRARHLVGAEEAVNDAQAACRRRGVALALAMGQAGAPEGTRKRDHSGLDMAGGTAFTRQARRSPDDERSKQRSRNAMARSAMARHTRGSLAIPPAAGRFVAAILAFPGAPRRAFGQKDL